MTSIGIFLKTQRTIKDLSLRDLHRLSGVSHSYIASLEADQTNPTMDTLEKLAKGLDMPLEQFLRGCGYLPGKPEESETLIPTGTE